MPQTTFDTLVNRIREVEPVIQAHADASDSQRHLAAEVALAMARAGLYRVAVPRSLNGFECHPVDQVKTIEAVSEIHGSAGWNLMIGIENMGILGAVYRRDVLQEMYDDPDLIIAGTLNPLGKAVKAEGGYRVSGQWPFASGVHNAKFFWSQSIVHENGERLQDEDGYVFCESMVPASEIEILDTWRVSGLRGSGSHDVRLHDVFVPDELISQVNRTKPYETGTLYRLPLYSKLAYNKVGVATGIARCAIRHFKELAATKKPRATFAPLSHREDAQHAIAEATRLVGAARSYVFDTISTLWEVVERGDTPSREQRALVQLACSGAAMDSVRAVELLHAAAGASVNFLSSPLERCMRDVMVVRQHIMVSPQYTNAIGRTLLGLESGTFLF